MRLHTWGAALAILIGGSAHSAPVYGDVNGNGLVDMGDAVVLCRVGAGLALNTDTIRRNGDVAPVNDYNGGSFGDGRITLLDAVRVSEKAAGLSTDAWPAKTTGYLLEAGDVYVTRKYDKSGTALTGPGTGSADVSTVFSGPISETVGGITYTTVFLATSSDGDVQRLVQVVDAGNTPTQVIATQLTLGSKPTTFNPPIVALKYPLQNGTSWNGTTTATDTATSTQVTATYTGSISGPVSVTMADGVLSFDNAYKVTVTYNAGALLYGSEYYWFVPFVGPVQHGFTRTALFATTAVNPDYKLVSANVHGVLYP
jgi:hypothetical protein